MSSISNSNGTWVAVPNTTILNPSYVTMEAWIYISTYATSSDRAIIMNKENEYEMGIEANTGRFQIAYQVSSGWSWLGNIIVPQNQWVFVASTWDGYNAKLYVNQSSETIDWTDGVLYNSYNNALAIGGRGASSIGNSGVGSWFNGLIGQVRLWNYARSSTEIYSTYNKELIGNESGLIGYWKINEGTGTTIIDYSSNKLNGTVYGASWSSGTPPVSSKFYSYIIKN